jgi:pyruvate dehydrogenase E1 component
MAYPRELPDSDPAETREWLDALESVLEQAGPDRASFLLERLSSRLTQTGARLPYTITTPYRNTIPHTREQRLPGDVYLDRRVRSLVRWNALAMVMRANQRDPSLGGHIASFASSATLYDIGFDYFFRAPTPQQDGDLVYIQGHSAPGIYARAFLEGRLGEQQLDNFRREVDGNGLSSYPHPWLMPDFWQFPTVSMGLGPLQAIYQAHVMKYLDARGLVPMGDRKVWCFMGDGESDEPESLGVISLAGRERLDNLIFVVNCNLQRLDGPVRGNGKIIQELEGIFKGAGWNVIKVLWGRLWDSLFELDKDGFLQQRMNETVDGEYQNYKAKGGAYTREHFFGRYPQLLKLVEHLSDDDIMRLNRGGHDPHKVYAAYHAAFHHKGQPTVILAKTVKGYGMGAAGESENITHSVKKLDLDSLRQFRDRFDVPIPDDELAGLPYFRPPDDAPEIAYMRRARERLGGAMPQRRRSFPALEIPALDAFAAQLKGSGDREISTTMAFVRILATLIRDRGIGKRVVPIVPDEARTFGMEGMFHQLGIYSSAGQLYEPVDAGQLTSYVERRDGQVLEEGINEAGAFAAWLAAATSYSTNNYALIPFYIYYSMFGFQRIGDLAWAAGDLRARGFLLGGTAGRTTLNGEGLQHQDGHSHVLANTIPNCICYDPAYAYELAVIVHHGLRRMYVDRDSVFFYITVMNENYAQPAMPDGAEDGIVRGIHRVGGSAKGRARSKKRVRLLGSGTILREVLAAAELLAERFGVASDVYSVTSFTELGRDGRDVERWNLLHPGAPPRLPYVEQVLGSDEVATVAATDYIRAHADQVRPWVKGPYRVLGTDGFGRSDTREKLRAHFEVDRRYVALAALHALCDQQLVDAADVRAAVTALGIDPEKPNPAYA